MTKTNANPLEGKGLLQKFGSDPTLSRQTKLGAPAKSASFVTEHAGIANQALAAFNENAAFEPERVALDQVSIPAGGDSVSGSGSGLSSPHRKASGGHGRDRHPVCCHVRGPSDGRVQPGRDHHPSSPRSNAAHHDEAPPSELPRKPDGSSIRRATCSGCHWGTSSPLSINSQRRGSGAALSLCVPEAAHRCALRRTLEQRGRPSPTTLVPTISFSLFFLSSRLRCEAPTLHVARRSIRVRITRLT